MARANPFKLLKRPIRRGGRLVGFAQRDRNFDATQIFNIHYNLSAWSNATYSIGNRRSNLSNAYECITAGTSTVAPTGQGSDIAPGGTSHWKWLSRIDYTDLQSWADNLVGPFTFHHVVYLWNNGPITTTVDVQYLYAYPHETNGYTTLITPAPGEGFRDKFNIPLAYDSTKGVTFLLPSSDGAGTYFNIDVSNVTWDGIQFKDPRTTGSSTIIVSSGTGSSFINCIFDGFGRAAAKMVALNGAHYIENCVFLDNDPSTSFNLIGTLAAPTYFVNCWFISVNNVGTNQAVYTEGAGNNGHIMRNCGIFGWSAAQPIGSDHSGQITVDHSITDSADFGGFTTDGGSNLFSKTIANQMRNATGDYRLKSGADCINAGSATALRQRTLPDIFGMQRDASFDIGPSEFFPILVSVEYIAALEFGNAVIIDAPISAEWGNNQVINAVVPFDYRQSIRSDAIAPVEILASRRHDAISYAEWFSFVVRDAPVCAEWGTARRMDAAVAAEWLGSRQADFVVPAEWRGGSQFDWPVPAEWRSSLSLDAVIPAEYNMARTVDAAVVAEWGLTQQRDFVVPAEWRGGLQLDMPAPVEWRGGFQFDAPTPTEWRGGQAIDVTIFAEWLTSANFAVDARIPIEWGALVQSDMSAPAEWGASVQRDMLALAEWTASVRRDMLVPSEWRGSIQVDQPIPAAFASSVQVDLPISAEFNTSLQFNYIIPTEWGGVVLTTFDTTIPIEWRGGIVADAPVSAEWRGGILTDTAIPSSWNASIQADTRIPVDYKASTTMDYPVVSEFMLSVRGDASSLAEYGSARQQDFIMSAEWRSTILLADAVIPAEFNATVLASANVPAEILSTRAFDSRVPAAWTASYQVDLPFVAEWRGGYFVDIVAYAEWASVLHGLTVDTRFVIEWGLSVRSASIFPLAWGLQPPDRPVFTVRYIVKPGVARRIDKQPPVSQPLDVTPMSDTMQSFPSKGPSEYLDYLFNYSQEFVVNDVSDLIVSAAVIITPSGTAGDITQGQAPVIQSDGKSVAAWLRGGRIGVVYSIDCIATTSAGRVLELSGIVAVKQI